LYVDSSSWLHRCHPLVRLSFAMAVFVAALLGDTPSSQLPLLVLVGYLVASTGTTANIVRLRTLFAIVPTMTFLIWVLFYGPDPSTHLWSLGPLAITGAGCRFALTMALKLTVLLAAGLVFLTVTRVEEFSYALTTMGLPYRIGFAITLAFRLVPVFLESAQKVVEAQRCRGFDFERGGLLERIRRYVPVLVPVFMGALRRTDGLAMALDARGFQLERERTSYLHYPMQAVDVVTIFAALALVAGYLGFWWQGVLAPF